MLPALAHLPPDAALLLFTLSAALLALELNRPGLILPGALGLTGALLAVASLAHQPLTAPGIVLAVTGLALLALGFRRTLSWPVTAAAALSLLLGLCNLLPPASQPPLHTVLAVPCALALGAGLGVLARIARRARRNKGLD